jgi:hypothetical protein
VLVLLCYKIGHFISFNTAFSWVVPIYKSGSTALAFFWFFNVGFGVRIPYVAAYSKSGRTSVVKHCVFTCLEQLFLFLLKKAQVAFAFLVINVFVPT